jgi:hypothetical protein
MSSLREPLKVWVSKLSEIVGSSPASFEGVEYIVPNPVISLLDEPEGG